MRERKMHIRIIAAEEEYLLHIEIIHASTHTLLLSQLS